ncbi:MAG TPA: alpha/beta hydrolase [Flexivirga sp.]|uniref:alpha/beta fold hydrolase n=1 Tax=Flexivirga sp. TaxID=1962927 RepID=UPI002C0F3AAE|nr:alpha/beta hydrolase [Flexivirga sp.]HWC23911.1 alpha/beta hydrolase [Flexivirga sp.]
MTLRRAYADTPLGQLHYAEDGAGRTVLMLHQAPRSLDEFAEVQCELSTDVHTIATDLLGFGMSPPLAAPQTIEAMADGVIALLDALEVEAPVLLGHHTGAAVALEVAAQAPERVDALVLSSMPWVGPARRASGKSVGVDDAQQRNDGSHLTELWSLRQPYYPADRPDLLDRFIRDALAPGVDPAEGHRACDRYVMDERIGLVQCPVLVLTATDDPFAAPALPHIVHGLTGAAQVTTASVDGAMIPAMEQCADQVAKHVRSFLAQLP